MEKTVIVTGAWILFVFGVFCLVDGLIALFLNNPCWIIRIGFGPLAITSSGVLVFLRSRIGG